MPTASRAPGGPPSLPNLAALRIGGGGGGGGGGEPEAATGPPANYQRANRMEHAKVSPPPPVPHVNGDLTIWFPERPAFEAADITWDSPPEHYQRIVDNIVDDAARELHGRPKYVFIVDGENVVYSLDQNVQVEHQTQLREMFQRVTDAEQLEANALRHTQLDGAGPSARPALALFLFTTKSHRHNPRVKSWREWKGAPISQAMRLVVDFFKTSFTGVGTGLDYLRPVAAAAYQLHIHVPTCGFQGDSRNPCQKVLFPRGAKSECVNYHPRSGLNSGPSRHALCEFDDVFAGRLYEAAMFNMMVWLQRVEMVWLQRVKEELLDVPNLAAGTEDDLYNIRSWERYRSQILNSEPPPVPLMITRDGGISYTQFHYQPFFHVNWEWLLFAPRPPGTLADYRQQKYINDLINLKRSFAQAHKDQAAPDVDKHMAYFSHDGRYFPKGYSVTVYRAAVGDDAMVSSAPPPPAPARY